MTIDGIAAETLIIQGVAGDAYYVTDGTVVAAVERQDGSRIELRMNVESARRLAEQLREQVRLLEAYRAEAGPAEGVEGTSSVAATLP
jgi:hypothetical protein